MNIGDVKPVQSIERTGTSENKAGGNDAKKSPARDRSLFSRVLAEGDGVVYQVLDDETGMILAQVPSEEVLRVAKRLQEMLADQKGK
jgi:hypothetical protein